MELTLGPNRKVKVSPYGDTVLVKFTDFGEGRHFAITPDQWLRLGQLAPSIGAEIGRLLKRKLIFYLLII